MVTVSIAMVLVTIAISLRVQVVTVAIVTSGAGYHCYIVESVNGYRFNRYEWCLLPLLYR